MTTRWKTEWGLSKPRAYHRNLPPKRAISKAVSAPPKSKPAPPKLELEPPKSPPAAGTGNAPEEGKDCGNASFAPRGVVVAKSRIEDSPPMEKETRAERPLVATALAELSSGPPVSPPKEPSRFPESASAADATVEEAEVSSRRGSHDPTVLP